LYVDGRWHTWGHLVTYAAEHPGTAQLEWLAHLEIMRIEDAPATIPFSEIDVPDDIASEEWTELNLPSEWPNKTVTQDLGNAWLDGGASAVANSNHSNV
jgi:RES domain-containing protein